MVEIVKHRCGDKFIEVVKVGDLYGWRTAEGGDPNYEELRLCSDYGDALDDAAAELALGDDEDWKVVPSTEGRST